MKTLKMMANSPLCESPSKYVEWKIRNFLNIRSIANDTMDSPTFSLAGAKWYIVICPEGQFKFKTFSWIGMYLMKEQSERNYCVEYRIGIKKVNGSELDAFQDEYIFPRTQYGWGTYKLIRRSTLLNTKDAIAPDGSLTIFCSARIVNRLLVSPSAEETASSISPSASTNKTIVEAPSPAATVEVGSQTSWLPKPTGEAALESEGISTLLEDFKNIYISRRCTDVTLLVQDKEFYAHRSILAARSSVFSSMFEHEFEEKSSGKVKISDCDPDSFEQFLLFLYTGKVDDLTSSKAINLYVTADKYDMTQLKEECVRCLVCDVSVDSFCDVIHLAVIHNDSDLLKACTDFFINNVEAILLTTKWQDLLSQHPLLCNELFIKEIRNRGLKK